MQNTNVLVGYKWSILHRHCAISVLVEEGEHCFITKPEAAERGAHCSEMNKGDALFRI